METIKEEKKADLELLKLTIESREFKIKTLIEENDYWRWEAKKLKEEIRFLEQCLDNKEKVNKSLREELDKLKSTYVYDAKQVRDIC